MMCIIKWDEKFFEASGLYIWVYRNGFLETSNEKMYKSNLVKIYNGKKSESLKNNKNNEREIK